VSDIWPDCMNWNLDRNGAAFSCKGYGALLKERDALAERLAEEVESHAITSANLERLQNRWDKRPVVDDLQARLAEAEQLLARWLKLYGGSLSSIIGKDTEDFLRTTDSATPRENARE
jgi:hypothetical protein